MDVTGRSLCTSALKLLQVLAQGETPAANDLADAFEGLQMMVDAWKLQRLTVPLIQRSTYSLVDGDGSYTLGSGGDFNQVRPTYIEGASLLLDSGTREVPIRVFTWEEYQRIPMKATEGQPQGIYVDRSHPLRVVKPYPVPDASMTLVLYWGSPLTQFADVNTTYDVPDGYGRALKYNLAIEIADLFHANPSGRVQAIATDSLADIKRVALVESLTDMEFDPGLVGRTRPSSIYTDA